MRTIVAPLLAVSLMMVATAAHTQAPPTARARLVDRSGAPVGTATLRQTPDDGVLIRLDLDEVPPGVHAFHIHETGRCDPPSFESAGDHYSPRGDAHGVLVPEGRHAGDLLNLYVPASGALTVEQLATEVSLLEDAPGTLFDDDGSTLVIHADPDDYVTQPAGGAGERIACGVIRR